MKVLAKIQSLFLIICILFLAGCNTSKHYQSAFRGYFYPVKQKMAAPVFEVSLPRAASETASLKEDIMPPIYPKPKLSNTKPNKTITELSKQEKKIIKQRVKGIVKTHKKELKQKQNDETIILALLSIFLPPLAVYLYEDSITTNFWVDLILTLLFWIPGIIFALLVIFADVSVG